MGTKKAPRAKARRAADPAATTTKRTKKTTARRAEPRAKGGAAPAEDQVHPLYPNMVRVEREIGGRTLSLEAGRMATLASGAVVARYGDTMVLASAQSASQDRDDIDFFPLTVDYRERAAAAGKFPGGYFKREGRPTTREILTSRIIDRSIRPLFPDGFRRETQVLSQVLSTDRENDSDIVAAIASFAALAVSDIPNGRTLGACRIGLRDGGLIINPAWSVLQSPENELSLTVSAHDDAIVMVEAGANQLPEDVMIEALELGHKVCSEIASMIDELASRIGKPKVEFKPPARDEQLEAAITKKFGDRLREAPVVEGDKAARSLAKSEAKTAVVEAFPAPAGASEKEARDHKKRVTAIAEELIKQGEREAILSGRRADGRGPTDIRRLAIEVGVLPRVHGSALFTRGETQALCIATLGTEDDRQMLDGIYPEESRRWLLHYNFPPFSVGEVRRMLAPGRREIGHGALAERAIEAILPAATDFPYSLRLTSEILESNGSSSMATVCGGTLALMDAGVPIKQPVAGIAMGLVVEGERVAILSDILGSEDHCGDMDFKVAGSGKGITALQMDIKCEGLTFETLRDALAQAREGRMYLLREMLSVIRKPREQVSPHAPRLVTIQIPTEKIGAVIGPMGRVIRGLQEEFEVRISVGDTGSVEVCGSDAAKVEQCLDRIRQMTAEVEIGTIYKGRVSGVKEFGAFVEILPGQEGLVHVSELSNGFIRSVTDVVRIGDEIEVKVIDIDDFGKVKLSRRALLPPPAEGEAGAPAQGRPERDRGRDRGFSEDREGGRERRPSSDRGRREFGDRESGDRPRREFGDRDSGDRGRRDRGDRHRDRPDDDAPRPRAGDAGPDDAERVRRDEGERGRGDRGARAPREFARGDADDRGRDDRGFRGGRRGGHGERDRGDRGGSRERGDREPRGREPRGRDRDVSEAGYDDRPRFAAPARDTREPIEPGGAGQRDDERGGREERPGRRGRGRGPREEFVADEFSAAPKAARPRDADPSWGGDEGAGPDAEPRPGFGARDRGRSHRDDDAPRGDREARHRRPGRGGRGPRHR